MYVDKFDNNIIFDYIKKLNYKDLIIFLIPFITFLYYLNVYNPGVLSFDSFYQLHQITTNHFDNWHPFFHTFIEMICLKIYPSIISIGVLQIFTFSSMWMVICKYNRNDEIKSKQFILQVLLTLIICFIPINAIYSITLWKDILFSYFLMFLCFLIEVLLDKKENVGILFLIIFSLTLAFVFHLRSNGIFVVLALLIIFGVYFFRNNKSKKYYISIPTLTIIFILLISSLSLIYNVEDTQKDVIYDKTVHILADYDLKVDVSGEDKQKIHELISEKDIREKFDPTFTDPTYAVANEQVFDNNKKGYIMMVIDYSLKNPLNFVEYVLDSSSMVWDITRDDDWSGYVYYVDLNNSKNSFFSSHHTSPIKEYENASSVNIGTQEYNDLNLFAESVRLNLITDTLFDSPALYMYLAFSILIVLKFVFNVDKVYLIYLPNFLNILTIFLSTPIQSNRYLYSNLLVCYLLIIILIKYSDRFGLNNTK